MSCLLNTWCPLCFVALFFSREQRELKSKVEMSRSPDALRRGYLRMERPVQGGDIPAPEGRGSFHALTPIASAAYSIVPPSADLRLRASITPSIYGWMTRFARANSVVLGNRLS